MNRLFWIGIAALTVTFGSCHKGVFDSGVWVTEERVITDNYHGVIIESAIDVVIIEDAAYSLKIEGGENKLPFIETKVIDGHLVLSEKRNHIRDDKQVRIFISQNHLSEISIDGSGDVTGDDIWANELEVNIGGSGSVDLGVEIEGTVDVDIHGSGDVRLTGDANQVNFDIDGSGDIDTRFIESANAFVFIDGSGDVRLTATEFLHVEIDGSGDVMYWGAPNTVEVDIDGSGDLIDME